MQNKVLKKISPSLALSLSQKKKKDFPTDPLYIEENIWRFKDMVSLQNYLFMSQIENDEKLAETFPLML